MPRSSRSFVYSLHLIFQTNLFHRSNGKFFIGSLSSSWYCNKKVMWNKTCQNYYFYRKTDVDKLAVGDNRGTWSSCPANLGAGGSRPWGWTRGSPTWRWRKTSRPWSGRTAEGNPLARTLFLLALCFRPSRVL